MLPTSNSAIVTVDHEPPPSRTVSPLALSSSLRIKAYRCHVSSLPSRRRIARHRRPPLLPAHAALALLDTRRHRETLHCRRGFTRANIGWP